MSLIVLEKPPKTSAAGNYLGYSLQQVRACYHLFRWDDDDQVSSEYIDDVAVHYADGSMLMEQAKSALSSNPLSDRSEELWKTFATWATLCKDYGVDPDATTFHLYVTPTKTGSLAKQLHVAGKTEAKALLKKLGKLLEEPKVPACAPHLETFLNADPALCAKIIERFEIETDDDPTEKVVAFARLFAPDAPLEFAAACVGLATRRLDKLAREKKPAVAACKVFRREVRTLAARSNLKNLFATPEPDAATVTQVVLANPLFVRQLGAVDLNRDMVLTAISDYLRANADKTFWGEEGRVLEETLIEFDQQLVRRHSLLRDEIEDVEKGSDEPARGRSLYRRCSTSTLRLGESDLPPHFVAGEYNHLAQARRLGWHPSYETLFPEET